jgi:hypothetical protein
MYTYYTYAPEIPVDKMFLNNPKFAVYHSFHSPDIGEVPVQQLI